MPGCVSQSLTSTFTSKSLALSGAIDCSAVGDLIVTLGIFLGVSDAVVGPNAMSGSAGGAGGGGLGGRRRRGRRFDGGGRRGRRRRNRRRLGTSARDRANDEREREGGQVTLST